MGENKGEIASSPYSFSSIYIFLRKPLTTNLQLPLLEVCHANTCCFLYSESGTFRIKFIRKQCKILRRTHQIEAIPVINAATEPVFMVSSPGFYQSPPQKLDS